MTVHLLPPQPAGRLRDADDLCAVLGLDFSDEQLAAITAPPEPTVIIAGAGSGKTTVMAARVVWLVGSGAVRPEEVLGLTFTRKAAAELSDRVRRALVAAGAVRDRGIDEAGEQVVMTYDAFAGRLVAEHGLRLGFESDPTLIGGATRFRLASRVVAAAAGPFEALSRLRPATVTERVIGLDADLQSHLVGPGELDAHARRHRLAWSSVPLNRRGNVPAEVKRALLSTQERLELASLVSDYARLKQRFGLVEFADQMAFAALLAVEVPAVSADLRARFRVVLLDEYQDTSSAQSVVLRGLFSGTTPDAGRGHSVTAVGDPFQAIYGWRGASATNIGTFAVDFPRVDGSAARRFALTVNRRSGPAILAAANTLSTPLRDRGEGASDQIGLLHAPSGTPPGSVRAATFSTWPEEVEWVADQVVAARTVGTAPRWADVAILTRRNADIAPLYAALTSRDVPVEIVGLGGLLHLPEIADVLAVLRLIEDATANPDLIRLLTGPRWRIGRRDLALLGRQARHLARDRSLGARPDPGLAPALAAAVAGTDPTDVVCLLDALDSPGDSDYSAAARQRFARVAAELRYLRQHSEEPVLDLVRRVLTTIGIDVEVSAIPEFRRSGRRDQLGAFLDAVAGYVDIDGDASLSGLLAWLQAEIDQGAGLEQAVPSDSDAVKVLTVHKAKGLEWEVVVLPALVSGVFPTDRVTDNWVTTAAVLPADLRGDAGAVPQLSGAAPGDLAQYRRRLGEEQRRAEDRLAYVAATRARHLLVGSGHWWRADLLRPREASAYLRALLAEAEPTGGVVARADPPGADNPLTVAATAYEWPAPLDPDAFERRRAAADAVQRARTRFARTGRYDDPAAEPSTLDEEALAAEWDADISGLLGELSEARASRRHVVLPDSLAAGAVQQLAADPDAYAAQLARPMPRPPAPAARFGTRFHAWVEQHLSARVSGPSQAQLVDPDDLPDRADGAADDADLRRLCRAFAAGRYGEAVPYAVEAPFTLLIGGRVVRGRIDAVYALPGADQGSPRFQVVDWKTGSADRADPLQLALYRLAWAELSGLALPQVDAVFYEVRTDRVVRPPELPNRADLERLLVGPPGSLS